MNKFEESDKFNEYQMGQIRNGLKKGLDVSIYAKPEFKGSQMEQIRYGLERGLDVSVYAKPEFDSEQMRQIRLGLENGLDINVGVCEWKQTSTARYKTSCGYRLEEYFDTNACYCKQCGKKIKILKN